MRLDKLTVHRLPGIARGFQVETPATVNIITGPNGSGKSSLVRAVRRLLWTHLATDAPFAVEAIFQRDGSVWKASREEGVDTRWWCHGETAPGPTLPVGHVARCFELGILDLVLPAGGEVENKLAEVINREMSGGVNLDEVGQKIFSFGPRLAAKKRTEWQNATSNLNALLRGQRHLAQQEKDLTEKRQELEKTKSSALRLELLSKLKTRNEVAGTLLEVQATMKSFAQGQDRVRLEDADDLTAMQKQLQEKNRKILERQTVLDTLLEQIESIALPAVALAAHDPGLLAKQVQRTSDLQGEIDRLREGLAREENALRQVLQELDPAADDTAVGPNPGQEIYAELAKIFYRLKVNQAETEGLENLLHLPEFRADGNNKTEDQIREKEAALKYLRRWLVSDSPQPGFPHLVGLVSGLVAAFSGWLLYANNSSVEGLITLLLGSSFAVFFLVLMLRGRAQSKKNLKQVVSKCQQAGLEIPEPLDRAHIQNLLDLETRDKSAKQVRKNLHDYLSSRVNGQQVDEGEINTLLAQFRQKHGLAMDRDTPELLHLLNAVPRFRKAETQVASLKTTLDLKQGELDQLLANIGPAFVAFGLEHPTTDIEAVRQQEILENRIAETNQLRETLKREERDLANLHSDLKEINTGLTNFWKRLGLPADTDNYQVRKLVEDQPDWLENKEVVARLQQEHDQLDKEFRKHPETLDPTNAEALTPEQLAAMLADLQGDVEARDSIQHHIGATEALVNQARGSSQMATAGAAVKNTKSNLLETLHQERETALGMMILEDVEQTYHHTSRPKVLSRAADSFKIFSQGRYELRVVPGTEKSGTFHAYDQESGVSLGLGELSDGTRAQLLLAVRLAFISENEGPTKPPIFLDESLTSSDPQRFAAIAVNLARWAEQENRQVIYLSSNPNDARAWQLALEDAALPQPAVIDLAKARGLGVDQGPHTDFIAPALEPAPGEMSPAEYANVLNVPQLNGWQAAGEVHLWYLLWDDLQLLHRLVLAMTPTLGRWLGRSDKMGGLAGMTEAQVENLRARGHCLEIFLRNWRIGRGRVLTGEVLDDSGYVSEKFRDKCRELLEEVQGDAAAFLEGLRHKKVRGFRGNKIVLLEEFFGLEGYLDSREVLELDELMGNVFSANEHEINCGNISVSEIRLLVSAWGESV